VPLAGYLYFGRNFHREGTRSFIWGKTKTSLWGKTKTSRPFIHLRQD